MERLLLQGRDLMRLGKRWSSPVSPRCEIKALRVALVFGVISNWTGLPVFFWTRITRSLMFQGNLHQRLWLIRDRMLSACYRLPSREGVYNPFSMFIVGNAGAWWHSGRCSNTSQEKARNAWWIGRCCRPLLQHASAQLSHRSVRRMVRTEENEISAVCGKQSMSANGPEATKLLLFLKSAVTHEADIV